MPNKLEFTLGKTAVLCDGNGFLYWNQPPNRAEDSSWASAEDFEFWVE